MAKSKTTAESSLLSLFQQRNRLLTTLREQSLLDPEKQSRGFIFNSCCETLVKALVCDSVWAGSIDADSSDCILYGAAPESSSPSLSRQRRMCRLLIARFGSDLCGLDAPTPISLASIETVPHEGDEHQCLIWPVGYRERSYGFIVLHCRGRLRSDQLKKEFIASIIDDIALALFSLDMAIELQFELEFNKEIVDTIQALMVTISPCGTIVSFNRRAEQVTGYTEEEILERYWVDVLTTPGNRLHFQRIFTEALKDSHPGINVKAPLLTKNGQERFVRWHGSIRHDIDRGQVGLVMLGIDETETLVADQQLNMLTARWEKIFIAIQDPVMVVSNDSIIIEANPATFAAAKKHRDEVVGKKVCVILHGGHDGNTMCPLEQFIGYQRSHIIETDLHGLHGTYMLTVSPLLEENGEINGTLLVARNLTQEEVVRAEAIRAAQLAALGELASGVAHEINNPINGIINYAQIILDDPADREANENLRNIISEGKRIAGIVANLLDFARCREELRALSQIEKIISNSLNLISHLLKKDGISCEITIAEDLPEIFCNEQQLQQVVLNLLSNARYALNRRFPQPCREKQLKIRADTASYGGKPCVRLLVVDYGMGIAPETLDRIFDPFFSTKPKGEGTGLGLSISHGLIQEHGGHIRVKSKFGEWSRFTIFLPVA